MEEGPLVFPQSQPLEPGGETRAGLDQRRVGSGARTLSQLEAAAGGLAGTGNVPAGGRRQDGRTEQRRREPRAVTGSYPQ